MAYITFLLATLTLPIVLGSTPTGKLNLKKIAEEINADPESTFKADHYGHDFIDIEEFSKSRLGLKLPLNLEDIAESSKQPGKNPFFTGPSKDIDPKVGAGLFFPRFYDARKQHSECRSIGLIRDQSNCGSCWAVSAASVFSDRICIFSNGKYNFSLSGQFTASCDKSNHGCQGGNLDKVWKFYQTAGCITGGEYQSDEGCQPYEIKPCGKYPREYPCTTPLSLTPKCRKLCTNEWYEQEYEDKIFRVSKYYQVGHEIITIFNEFLIQREIITNGPVQAGFLVYPDFAAYKSGIYRHKTYIWQDWPTILGGHAVKIIGWGEEKGVKYWIVSNSWTEEWGENGTFRIVRGENNVFIESMVYAGIPKI